METYSGAFCAQAAPPPRTAAPIAQAASLAVSFMIQSPPSALLAVAVSKLTDAESASGFCCWDGKESGSAGLTQRSVDGAAAGAGRGNRTLVFSLEGCCSTIELYPRAGPQIGENAKSTGEVYRASAIQILPDRPRTRRGTSARSAGRCSCCTGCSDSCRAGSPARAALPAHAASHGRTRRLDGLAPSARTVES